MAVMTFAESMTAFATAFEPKDFGQVDPSQVVNALNGICVNSGTEFKEYADYVASEVFDDEGSIEVELESAYCKAFGYVPCCDEDCYDY